MKLSPAPVVSITFVFIPSCFITLFLVYNVAPLDPFVRIIALTLPINKLFIFSFSFKINDNSSSDNLIISAYGKNSLIVLLQFSGLSHSGNLIFKSKLIIPFLSLTILMAFLCAYLIGASIKLTEQKCSISSLNQSVLTCSCLNNISALGLR